MISEAIVHLVQALIVFLMVALSCYYLHCDKLHNRALIEYENEFLEMHYGIISRQRVDINQEVIPLTFQRQDDDYLEYLCGLIRKNWMMAYYADKCYTGGREPAVEEHYFKFVTLHLAPEDMKIRLVRCAKMYVIVDGGDSQTGYILQLDKEHSNDTRLVFNMAIKFSYNEQLPQLSQAAAIAGHYGHNQ